LNALLRVQPWSVGACLLGLIIAIVSTLVQMLLFWFGTVLYFAPFLPAVFLAGLLVGPLAAATVVLFAIPMVWWAFLPPFFEFSSLSGTDVTAITMFLFMSLLLIFLADVCRAVVVMGGRRNFVPKGRIEDSQTGLS
jgi:hypothetical protein